MNKDSFNSSGRPAPGSSAPTQRLGPTGTGPLSRAAQAIPDPELRERATQLVERLEARVELLIRACQRASLPMPGVVTKAFKHAVPPNAAQVLEYLEGAFQADARLAQGVQVAIYRFQQVQGTVTAGEAPTDLEALRRQVFFLTNLSAEFKTDPILTTLFPPPQTREGSLKAIQRSPADQKREAAQREELVKKAIALGQSVAPRMATAKLVLTCIDEGLASNVALVLTPHGRQAKMLAVALTGDNARIAKLREAYAAFEALKAILPQVRAGEQPIEVIRPLAIPLGALATTFADHALLRDLFTRPLPPAKA